ncbi:MAG: carboxymuconolactone decarboxylase family protein [Micropepsaceae bacterium]
MTPRIAPLEPPFPAEAQEAFDRIMPPGVPPLTLFTTLARAPRVYAKFNAGGLLDRGAISMRERELMINRTCARAGNAYEWGVHVAFFAERAGLDAAEIEALALQGWDWPLWTPADGTVIRLADELHDGAAISDALWIALRRHFSEEQILELIALAGFYRTVAYYCNGLKLEPEAYGAPLPKP